MTEELLMHYEEDFGMVCRIGRFHNIYGPCGTWKGGREKAPAAFCRKAITSTESFEMWGNGKQTRSFCYIDDAVEGILRLMASDYKKPLNVGSDEMVSMNQMADSHTDRPAENLGQRLRLRHLQREDFGAREHREGRVLPECLRHPHRQGRLTRSRLPSDENRAAGDLLIADHLQDHAGRSPRVLLADHAL